MLFAIGAGIFVARYFGGVPRASAVIGIAAFALVPVVAWLRARRRFLSPAGAIAWLDRESGGSGALLTHFDLADERWIPSAVEAQARIAALPRVRVRREFAPSLVALCFVTGALWIEKPVDPRLPATHLAESALEDVKEQLVALQEVVELPEEKAQELAERIERVQENLRDAPADASLEALDRTSDELASQAEKSLAAAERANDALDRSDAAQSAEAAKTAVQEALKELREGGLAAKLPEAIHAELTPGTLELPPGVQLSSADLSKLSNEIRSALDARLAKLGRAGLISPRQLERATSVARVTEHVCDENCKRGGTCRNGGRSVTAASGEEAGEDGLLAEGEDSVPGRGGVNRGRGDAEMTWGEEAQGRADDFAAKALDPARVLDAESTAVLGIGAAAPPVDAHGESAGSAPVEAGTGEGAWRRRLAPHHREAVKRFFSGPVHR